MDARALKNALRKLKGVIDGTIKHEKKLISTLHDILKADAEKLLKTTEDVFGKEVIVNDNYVNSMLSLCLISTSTG
jgi:hypothetical protein